MKLYGAILLGMMLAAPPALAEDTSWRACQQDNQCAIISGNCGVEWAANKTYATISRKNPPRPDMDCTKPIEFHPDNTVAKCMKGKCVLIPPGTYAGGVKDVEQ